MKRRYETMKKKPAVRKEARLRLKTAQKGKSGVSQNRKNRNSLALELRIHQTELEMQNDELKRSLAEIQVAKDKYLGLFRYLPVGMAILDRKFRILEANPAVSRVLRSTAAGLIKTDFRRFVPTKDLNDFACFFNSIFQAGSRRIAEFDVAILTWDHQVFQARLVGVRLITADPFVFQCCLALVDISSLKTAEDMLRRGKVVSEELVQSKNRQLKDVQEELVHSRRLSDIGMLASTIAHELRNPLAAIGLAVINLRRKSKDASLERHIGNIEKKVKESDQIINNLLFYARIKNPVREPTDIFRLLCDCADDMEKYRKKEISILLMLEDIQDLRIEGDKNQLSEVFSNILNNACEAVESRRGIVKVTGINEQGFVKIEISDNGPGIGAEILLKIFDAFFTTKARGTGLGLAVCREIILLHSGTIEVVSQPGSGTSVFVTLPKDTAGDSVP